MNIEIQQHIEKMLAIPVANVAVVNEQSINKGVLSLFVAAGASRSILYRYATISSNGNINFHAMSPFTFIDDNQSAQYRKKTIYASVNLDSQQDKTDKNIHYNNNLGNFLLLLKGSIVSGGKSFANPYNKLDLHSPIIKQGLIPANIDKPQLELINQPALELQAVVNSIKFDEDIEPKEKSKLYIEAYNEYKAKVEQLYYNGLLDYSFIIVNPKPNSVSISMGLEESMKATSNPWLNINTVLGLDIPVSKLPIINQYSATVQIVDIDDLSLMFSDNNNMLGKRTIWTNQETGKSREALSKVAIIKDYNSDTPILIEITDSINMSNNPDARGRVQAFEDLLDKGINTFTVNGSLSPVVRLKDSNGGRNGVVFFELIIDTYSVYQSNNTRSTLESDAFGSLSFDAEGLTVELEEGSVEAIPSDNIADTVDLTSSFSPKNKSNDLM